MLHNIKEIHIEPTSLCNAECPMCARNIKGHGLNPYITLKSLDRAWFERNMTPQTIKNLKKIFFCGNVGDPASAPELLDIIAYLKECNQDLIVGLNTNGGLKTTTWWSKLGHLLDGPLDYCVFSIDGLEDTNHLYRRNVNWHKIMQNVQAYISTGAIAHWDMLVFDHNKHQIKDSRTLAYDMGFSWFRTKETDRWDTYASNDELSPAESYTPPSYSKVIECEKDRDSSVFLDYTGKYWPCCHMAEAYLNKIGLELHSDIKEYNNIELLKEYKTKLDSNKPFYICRRACGLKNKRSQWKTEEQLR
jgi:MoaA/NifB/PqqE/SkfB family radical SAM enzyme